MKPFHYRRILPVHAKHRPSLGKRLLSILVCLAFMAGPAPIQALAEPVPWPENVSISAEGGIVMDADSGVILYGKNMHTSYYPASITKILTALLIIENFDLDDTVTFSHNAVFNVEAGSTSAGMDVGDTLTVRDCLYAMMLKSANEVANALAEYASGSIEAFAAVMNDKARSLGCTDSHFNNPSGLNDPDHYTSAHDMALIARAAFQNEIFTEIDSTLYYDLPPTKRNPEGFRIYPGHRMLKKNMPQYYPGIVGGKTGYTSLAGNTLVTCAERDGVRLIAVVLNGHSTHYVDTKALLDFGFRNFQSLDVADYDTTYTSITNDMSIAGLPTTDLSVLHVQSDCRITLPAGADFSDTVSTISYDLPEDAPSDAIARISYEYGGRQVGYTYLVRNSPQAEPAAMAQLPMPMAAPEPEPVPEETQSEPTEAPRIANMAEGISSPLAGLISHNDQTEDPEHAPDRDGSENPEENAGGLGRSGGSGSGASEDLGGSGGSGSGASGDPEGSGGMGSGLAGDPGESGGSGSGPSGNGTDSGSGGFLGRIFGGIAGFISSHAWLFLGLGVLALGAGAVVVFSGLRHYIAAREKAERALRYKRRQQRLQDMGVSTEEFDMMLHERRSGGLKSPRRRFSGHKHHKSFLDGRPLR
jgi:D-alanyl-D-alanine carboxypeptidase